MAARSNWPFEYHPLAREELLDAGQWYSERDPKAGEDFFAAIDHAIGQVVTAPERWPNYMHGTRRYVIQQFPYLLVYRLHQDRVQIIAVAHGKRRPGYWSDRVE